MNKEQKWTTIKRILAVLMAIGLWFLSVKFSQQGFGITLPAYAWMGYILALSVTVMELVLNSGNGLNPTLYVAGIIAYLYGIGTNIYGILAARTLLSDISAWDWAFSVGIGLLIEVAPEPFFMYGIGVSLGDLVTTLMSGFKRNGHKNGVRQPIFVDSNPSIHTDDTYTRTLPDTRPDGHKTPTENKVKSYVYQHRKPDGSFPSVREVAHAIGKDKSTVGEIMARMRRKVV